MFSGSYEAPAAVHKFLSSFAGVRHTSFKVPSIIFWIVTWFISRSDKMSISKDNVCCWKWMLVCVTNDTNNQSVPVDDRHGNQIAIIAIKPSSPNIASVSYRAQTLGMVFPSVRKSEVEKYRIMLFNLKKISIDWVLFSYMYIDRNSTLALISHPKWMLKMFPVIKHRIPPLADVPRANSLIVSAFKTFV